MDRPTAFETAQRALEEQGYQIARRDQTTGFIQSVPIEGPLRSGDARLGMTFTSKNRTRHLAEVRVEEAGGIVRVNCKVVVQELVTEAERFFAEQGSAKDSPGQTPIDRDAATTDEQNTVWKTIRREQAAERAILEAILNSSSPRHDQQNPSN